MLRRTTVTVTGAVAALLLWGLATPGLAAPDAPGRQLSGLRPTPPSGSSATASAAAGGARADFDGDGIDDLVSAYNSVTQWMNGSSMVVFYSSPQGQQNGENYFGIGTYTAQGVEFAAGDFDNDGYDDLVMGLPFTGPHDGDSFGSAYIWYGSANGLHVVGGRMSYVDQNTGDIPGTSESGDEFGRALAAGDLNSDGYDDLAVGSPGEAIGTTSRAGMIHVFLGGPDGIPATAVGLSQADAQVPGESEAGDEFGMSVAIGDVTGDGYGDLAVGSPGENGSGMVTLLKGTASGIAATGATAQVAPTTAAVTPHRLGQTVTLADLTGDDCAEVSTGAPDSTVIGHTTAGAVSIHRGTFDGLTS
ncbi:MAG TPA: FG-GAP and VCBS repeat-containing protein, partial [Micromonospora sp.]